MDDLKKTPEVPSNQPLLQEEKLHGPLDGQFVLEVIKNGSVIERREVKKREITFGRSRDCDFPLDHPSISRNHAVIKWIPVSGADSGGKFFLQDLNSSHGSFVNKVPLKPGQIVRLEVNNSVLKFGGSSRTFLLNSTDPLYEEPGQQSSDKDGEHELELDERDEIDEEDLETLYEKINVFLMKEPIAATNNENVFSSNPVKCIQDWFEREGLEFSYEVSHNHNNFRVEIVINIEGRDFKIKSEHNGKKKDAIAQASLKSCRLLDAFQRLFPWQSEKGRKRKLLTRDDDNEDVLDETASDSSKKETKREKGVSETHESLLHKWTDCSHQLASFKAKLASLSCNNSISDPTSQPQESEGKDSLDSFMSDMKNEIGKRSNRDDKIQQSKLKLQIKELEKKQRVLELLMKAAKPDVKLPSVTRVSVVSDEIPPVPKSVILHHSLQIQAVDSSIPNPLADEPSAKPPEIRHEVADCSETAASVNNMKPPPPLPHKEGKRRRIAKIVQESNVSDINFINWIPPADQDGSGNIPLNDKLGY